MVLKVVGGEALRAGLPTSFRVVSSWADDKKGEPVEVKEARIGGVSALDNTQPGAPALLQAAVLPKVDDPANIALVVSSAEREETLHFSMPVRRMSPEPALPESPPTLKATKLAHRVSVLPEAGVLASGLTNQVFVRVRALDGVPLNDARVTVRHASLPDGKVEKRSDASGLISFDIDAKRPSFRFLISVEHGGETSEIEELLIPVGRQMLLRTSTPSFKPEAAVRARLTTWREDAEVFCDLFQGDVLLWSQRASAAGHTLNLDLGPWPEGRYSLQCSDHPWALGEAYATAAVLVGDQEPLEALLTELRDQQYLHPSGLVAPPGTKRELATSYWSAILRDPPTELTILVSTRASDLASRTDAHESEKTRLLVAIGLVFLLVLAWMLETILKNIIDRRDRLRTYAAESFMDAVPVDVDGFVPGEGADRETLLKTRGVLSALVFLGAIIANVIGIIWLFALIR